MRLLVVEYLVITNIILNIKLLKYKNTIYR